MGKLNDLIQKFERLNIDEIMDDVVETTGDELVEMNKDDMWRGLNVYGEPIRPNYLEDPYFKNHWMAKRYVKWKQKITPNPERNPISPNLFITGSFYNSLYADAEGGNIVVRSSIPMGDDIIDKYESYGSPVVGPTRRYIEEEYDDEFMRRIKQKIKL